jgi:hypothetical protein
LTAAAISGSFANVSSGQRVAVDGSDASFLVTVGASQVILSDFLLVPPILEGDYTDDGVVNAADYVAWRKLAGTNIPLENETRSPGQTDNDDYQAWRENFGNTASGSGNFAANTPEPSTWLLATLALLAVSNRRAIAKRT